jgi:hypothetical protein
MRHRSLLVVFYKTISQDMPFVSTLKFNHSFLMGEDRYGAHAMEHHRSSRDASTIHKWAKLFILGVVGTLSKYVVLNYPLIQKGVDTLYRLEPLLKHVTKE